MLTDTAVRNAQPDAKDYKLTDSGGLSLFVTRKGHKSWRWKYRTGGKERRLLLGAYPAVTLKMARSLRDDARKTLDAGRDPQLEAKRVKLVGQARSGATFEKYARDWHESQKARWKQIHATDVITSMERDLFPVIGFYPIGDIDEPLMLAALQLVEKRGAIETARRLRQRAERVFKYAKGAGAGNANPAVDVKETLKPLPQKRRWPALVAVPRLRSLIADVDGAGAAPLTRLASRFLATTAQRPGMVRNARWEHFEGIDWDDPACSSAEAIWRVPAERMKLEFDLRDDDAYDHLVPLAPQSVDALRATRRLTGGGPLPFCSIRDVHDAISENAIGYLYNRIGYRGLHVPHGWRSSFSTIMNERAERAHPGASRLIIDRLIIDLMLAHVPAGMSATEFRYNRAGYMDRRRELAVEWADMLLDGAAPAANLLKGRRRPIAV